MLASPKKKMIWSDKLASAPAAQLRADLTCKVTAMMAVPYVCLCISEPTFRDVVRNILYQEVLSVT